MVSDNTFTYSNDGRLARYDFFKDYNDINIFVEDTDNEYIYERILKRLLPSDIKIVTLHALNGKKNVINACLESKNSDDVYIVDGDFDIFLHPDRVVQDERLIYLQAYNIENYYIDKEATISYMQGVLQKNRQDTIDILKFDDWLQELLPEASKLFLLFCFIQKKSPNISNVSSSFKYINTRTGFIETSFVNSLISELSRQLNLSPTDIENETAKICDCYETFYGKSYFELICGKFLLHSLLSYLCSKTRKHNIDSKQFKWSLVCNFDINKLSYIKDKILILIKKHTQ